MSISMSVESHPISNEGQPPIPLKKTKTFLQGCDRFFSEYRSSLSLLGGLSPILLYCTSAGVMTAAGTTVAIATTACAIALTVFEKTKPTSENQIAVLNLMHHFIAISLPFMAGAFTISYLQSSLAKHALVGISLLASSVYTATNMLFPSINHGKIYRKQGLV